MKTGGKIVLGLLGIGAVVGAVVLAKSSTPPQSEWMGDGWHIVLRVVGDKSKTTESTWTAYHNGELVAAGTRSFMNRSDALQDAFDRLRIQFPDVEDLRADVLNAEVYIT
jgi:hypothetical protein